VRWAGGQWWKAVRPPVSVERSRGTGLGHLHASLALGARALGAQWGQRGARAARRRAGSHALALNSFM
jgi:hypothetical protein